MRDIAAAAVDLLNIRLKLCERENYTLGNFVKIVGNKQVREMYINLLRIGIIYSKQTLSNCVEKQNLCRGYILFVVR